MEAVKAMVDLSYHTAGQHSIEELLAYFKHLYFEMNDEVLAPNDFADFELYFLKKAIPAALSQVCVYN